MAMDLLQLELELVRDEGEVLHAYQDTEGLWTIGVGQLIDHRKGGGISKAASRFMLGERIAQIAKDLDREIPWWRQLSDARQRVLANMAYNLGVMGLLGFHNTLASIKSGYYDVAATQMLESKWAKTVGQRAVRLAAMMRLG